MPLVFSGALLALAVIALSAIRGECLRPGYVDPKTVGLALYQPYVLGVELVSVLLLAGLVAAFHLAPPPRWDKPTGEAVGEAKEATRV